MTINIPGELKLILDTIDQMKELEIALSRFYGTCAEAWAANAPFWQHLSREEAGHADTLGHISEIISARPDRFTKGRAFHALAARTVIQGVEGNTQKVRDGLIDERKALVLARDIENSIMESRYIEIVNTDDTDFKALVRKILEETSHHRAMINEKLR